jgi:acyl carrier protein
MKSIQNNKIIIINLLKKFGVNKIKDLNYNIVTGGDLDSLRIMQFIIELQEKIKKKIVLSKLVIKKNQTIKGLLKIIK